MRPKKNLCQPASRGNYELIKKVYLKQKEDSVSDDWFQTLQNKYSEIQKKSEKKKLMLVLFNPLNTLKKKEKNK